MVIRLQKKEEIELLKKITKRINNWQIRRNILNDWFSFLFTAQNVLRYKHPFLCSRLNFLQHKYNHLVFVLCKTLIESNIIVLPCKIGTPLYFLSGDLEKCEIIESSTWSYIIDSFGLITIEETLYELSYKNNYEYIFGSTVFSTREEAEKALYKI